MKNAVVSGLLCLGFLLFFCCVTPMSLANVIFEPEDDFYEEKAEEVEISRRAYLTASADGNVKVYQSPENGRVVRKYYNNQEIRVTFQWNDWYFYEDGWIHSEDVSLIYDTKSFLEEHETTVYEDDGYTEPVVQMYTYPNSGESYLMEESPDYSTIGDAIGEIFVDDEGKIWGYIAYYMAMSGWVCMDDPTNEHFDSGFVPVEPSVSQLRGSDAVAPPSEYGLEVATGFVVVFSGMALFLLVKIKKVKK